MFIVDAHQDLAYTAIKFNRDLQRPLAEIRAAERSQPSPNGRATVTFPTLRKGGIGLVFGTIFVAPTSVKWVIPDPRTSYSTAEEAHQLGMNQLDYYHRLADADVGIRLVGDNAALEEVVASHQSGRQPLLGIVPLMEGADPIRTPEEAELWYARGLRLVGLAWDDTRYAAGAWQGGGGLTRDGRALLEVMAEFGFILDLTHMSEKATLEALDSYAGPIVATHSNARALVPGERHFSDLQIRRVAEHEGLIGVVLYNVFLKEGYQRGGPKESVTLTHVVAHIDHICQTVGDAQHVGIGSDLDGGFGADDIPAEMDSAADMPLVAAALRERGYTEPDIANIMGGNWLNFLRRSWQ
jgi:membrane dipeptidase